MTVDPRVPCKMMAQPRRLQFESEKFPKGGVSLSLPSLKSTFII